VRNCYLFGEKSIQNTLLKSLKGRHHSEDIGIDGMLILKWIFGIHGVRVWIGLIWLRIEFSGGLLYAR
jgi:hypothetical protein